MFCLIVIAVLLLVTSVIAQIVRSIRIKKRIGETKRDWESFHDKADRSIQERRNVT